jgi:hypothetical protein
LNIIILEDIPFPVRVPRRGIPGKGESKKWIFPLFVRSRRTNKGRPGKRYPAGGS